ncbi:MAG: peptidase M48 Ste24p, partial [Pseudomonadota bacterium]|nr:peptidase M48 Ste24p [Pseudomonadota bacterium]
MQETQAVFFDGKTAGRIPVTVSLGPDRLALFITGDGLPEPLRWPLGELRGLHSDGAKHQVILTLRQEGDDELARHTARLVLEDTVAKEWLLTTRPDLFRKDVPKGTMKRIAKFTGMAVGATVLMLFVILPAMANTLAAIIPIEREVAFGKTVVAQIARVFGGVGIDELTCQGEEGQIALQVMVDRLTENQDMTYTI